MAYSKRRITSFFSLFLFSSPAIIFSQQFSSQKDYDSSEAFSSDDIASDGLRTEPYLETVSKSNKAPSPFRPTPSDLLIQQAESKLQIGREAYRLQDDDRARKQFDGAIELMLQASDRPSDRSLYEHEMEKMVDSIHRLDMAGLGAAQDTDSPQFDRAPLEDLLQMTFPVDPKLKTKVQGELNATASQLPLAMNDSVLGYINYFSGRGHGTIVAGLQRAGKYRPMIQRVLAEEGVPQELINLAQAESGFLPRAVSNKAAVGMWQFVKWRGQEYGLNQTAFTDERLDPEKATRAAARHLKDLYKQFGDWYLAIAAYNCGPGNVQKAVERTGYADFFELRARHAIPSETTNYVPIILALTIMSKNEAEYGLTGIVPEAPLEYDTVSVTAPAHLALIGDLTDTPTSQLLELNPALLRNVVPEGYALRVPKGSGETLAEAIEKVPVTQRASSRMHRVESGDTLATIAKRYGSTSSRIASANDLQGNDLAAGAHLLIPAAISSDTAYRAAARHKTAKRTVSHHSSTALIAQTHRRRTIVR